MANTNTITNLVVGQNQVVVYFTMVSDGTEETDLVIYDSSAIATLLGKSDSLNCSILELHTSLVGDYATANNPRIRLEFDATTDVMAWNVPLNAGCFKFRKIGGLKNTSGTGITGDITLTSTALQIGDTLALTLIVRPY